MTSHWPQQVTSRPGSRDLFAEVRFCFSTGCWLHELWKLVYEANYIEVGKIQLHTDTDLCFSWCSSLCSVWTKHFILRHCWFSSLRFLSLGVVFLDHDQKNLNLQQLSEGQNSSFKTDWRHSALTSDKNKLIKVLKRLRKGEDTTFREKVRSWCSNLFQRCGPERSQLDRPLKQYYLESINTHNEKINAGICSAQNLTKM